MMKSPTKAKSLQEQRRYPRVNAKECKINYRRMEGSPGSQQPSGDPTLAAMNNLSAGGVSFQNSEAIPTGTMLALEMTLAGQPDTVISMGKVAWCEQDGQGGYDIGVEFWWIGWKDETVQKQVRSFIADALRRD